MLANLFCSMKSLYETISWLLCGDMLPINDEMT